MIGANEENANLALYFMRKMISFIKEVFTEQIIDKDSFNSLLGKVYLVSYPQYALNNNNPSTALRI